MNSWIATILYIAPFSLFVFTPTIDYAATFLACYVPLLFGSVAYTVRQSESKTDHIELYHGLYRANFTLFLLSLILLMVSGIATDPNAQFPAWYQNGVAVGHEKFQGAIWIFLSLLFPTVCPLQIARLGNLLKKEGLEGLKNQDSMPTGMQHFCIEYSTARWYRHGPYLVWNLLSLSLYIYAWSIFGLSWTIYSIAGIVFILAVLSIFTRRKLGPFTVNDVMLKIETLYSRRTITTSHLRPPGYVFAIIASILTLLAYYRLVTTGYLVFDLAVLSLIVLVYAGSIGLAIWTNLRAQN